MGSPKQPTPGQYAQLEKAGINYHYTESTGGHTWANWRIYLNEFAPSLFK